jgi:hypothetical protein
MCWNICYGNRLGYSGINTVRSALSALLSLGYTDSLGEYRLMKGVFNQRPALPRYQHIWDVNSVLEYLALLNPVNVLSFYTLTLKCVMLLCLLSGQRVQTLQQICLEDCAVTDGVLRIKHSSILKITKPGNHLDDIVLPAYTNDNCLCIINTFSEYVNRTKELRQRGCKRLLISTIKPYWPVTINTISRWIKSVLKQSGVDTDKFKAHSVRGNQLQQLRQLMYLY